MPPTTSKDLQERIVTSSQASQGVAIRIKYQIVTNYLYEGYLGSSTMLCWACSQIPESY